MSNYIDVCIHFNMQEICSSNIVFALSKYVSVEMYIFIINDQTNIILDKVMKMYVYYCRDIDNGSQITCDNNATYNLQVCIST